MGILRKLVNEQHSFDNTNMFLLDGCRSNDTTTSTSYIGFVNSVYLLSTSVYDESERTRVQPTVTFPIDDHVNFLRNGTITNSETSYLPLSSSH